MQIKRTRSKNHKIKVIATMYLESVDLSLKGQFINGFEIRNHFYTSL